MGGILRTSIGAGNVLAGIANRLQAVAGGLMSPKLALCDMAIGGIFDILARTPCPALDTLLVELLVHISSGHGSNLLRDG